MSLQRELGTLCNGPSAESAFFDSILADLGNNSGKDDPRPGQNIQEDTINDYQTRLDALKRNLDEQQTDLISKLEQSGQFRNDLTQ